MERYHIFKLGLAILFYATYCIRPMLVGGLRINKTDLRPEDYYVFYQVKDGTPGIDFPILSQIPRTAFSCENFESGYYADLDTDCQVFHICDEGRKISFLCPNGTIFEQSDLICEWWYKVNCTNAPNLYHESAERLREDVARRKTNRKVYLDGRERNHGAVMRIEESLSVTSKKNGQIYEFSPRAVNIISSNANNRLNIQAAQRKGPDRNKAIFSSRSGDIPSQRTFDQSEAEQKPKRFNDAETGNYLNNVDQSKDIKEYHVQFSGTSPALDTASSERHVQTRFTTPSSLKQVSSSALGETVFRNQLSGSRGSIKYRPSIESQLLPSSTVKPTDEYNLGFPKHKSQIISESIPRTTFSGSTKIDSSRIDLGRPENTKQEITVGKPPSDILNRKLETNDSGEVQIPQETASFTKSSYNTIQPSSRKFSTVNPYPNHRTTYSDLKQPSIKVTNFLGSIKSVTPQYVTTQSINNGKPFVGSTVGTNIYGNKLRESTLAPEVNTATPDINVSIYGNTFDGSTLTPEGNTITQPAGLSVFGKSLERLTLSPEVNTITPLVIGNESRGPTNIPEINAISPVSPSTVKSFSSFQPIISTTYIPSFKESDNAAGQTVTPTPQPDTLTTDSTISIPLEDSTNTAGQIDLAISSAQPVVLAAASTDNEPPFKDSTVVPSQTKVSKGIISANSYTSSSLIPGVSVTTFGDYVPASEDSTRTPGQIEVSTLLPTSRIIPTTYVSPFQGNTGTAAETEAATVQPSISSTIPPLSEHSTKRTIDHATVYGSFSKSPVTTPLPPSGIEIKFGNNVDKVTVQLSKSVGGQDPKYGSTVITPISNLNDKVRISGVQGTVRSTTVDTSSEPVKTTGGEADVGSTERPSLAVEITPASSSKESLVTTQAATDTFVHVTDLQTATGVSSSKTLPQAPLRVATESSVHATDLQSGTETDAIDTSLQSRRPAIGSGSEYLGTTNKPLITVTESTEGTTNPIYSTLGVQSDSSILLKSKAVPTTIDGGRPLRVTIKGPVEVIHFPGAAEGTTLKPVEENLTYGSTVVPPLLTSDVFAHISDFSSTIEPASNLLESGSGTTSFKSTSPTANKGLESFASTTVPLVDISLNSIASTFSPKIQPIIKEEIFSGDSQKYESASVPTGLKDTVKIGEVLPGAASAPSLNAPPGTPVIGLASEGSVSATRLRDSYSTVIPPLLRTGTTVRDSNLIQTLPENLQKYGSTGTSPSLISGTSAPSGNLKSIAGIGGDIHVSSESSDTSPLLISGTLVSTESPKSTEEIDGSLAISSVGKTIEPSVTTVVPESVPGATVTPLVNLLDEGVTLAPKLTENNSKYSSTIAPLIGDTKSALAPVDSTFLSSIGADTITNTVNGDFGSKIKPVISSVTLPNLKSIMQGTDKLKLTDDHPKYGSTVIPPLLTPDAFVHVGDFQTISKPIGDVPISGVDVSSPVRSKVTLKGKDIGGSRTIPSEANISLNIIGSTLTPDDHTFSENLSLKSKLIPSEKYSGKLLPVSDSSSSGFYVTKDSDYDFTTSSPVGLSSTEDYIHSTPLVSVSPISGGGQIKPVQTTLSAPKLESSTSRDLFLTKSASQWPRPFQTIQNLLDSRDGSTKTEDVTPPYLNYKISSARPFKLPDVTPSPTVPTPFTTAVPKSPSVYENVDTMINLLKEITNATDQDFSSETPRPGLVVPPSAGPQTLHTLAVYFANALDGIAAEREKLTGEELDPESKEKLTSLLTQMTMYRYKELFKGKEADNEEEVPTTVATEEILKGDDSENLIQTPGLRQLAKNFSLALSSYLDNPEAFRKDLESLRPTEPPSLGEDNTDVGVGEEELLNFSDADSKSSFSPLFPTAPSVTPTWGYIIAPKPSRDNLDVKNSLSPDLHAADTQSFVPGFNNLAANIKDSGKIDFNSKKELPEAHWTASPGATKLWQSTFSVNPAILNEHFITTEPSLPETSAYDASAASTLSSIGIPQTEIQYDLRSLPKISVNSTDIHGILIDFVNVTKADESNRLQRLLKKLNTTEDEFLSRMREIESNPITKRLILLLISECAVNATEDLTGQSTSDLFSKDELLESSNTNSAVASLGQARHLPNSDIPELVDPSLQEDDQDTRALQLLNSLYTIAAKFGK